MIIVQVDKQIRNLHFKCAVNLRRKPTFAVQAPRTKRVRRSFIFGHFWPEIAVVGHVSCLCLVLAKMEPLWQLHNMTS